MEAIPSNAHLPREKEVDLFMLVDSNHASNKWTRRSGTWFMIYMSISLIY